MKKHTFMISDLLFENKIQNENHSQTYLSQKFSYFLYYSVICNIILLLIPLIYIKNKFPLYAYISFFSYNIICIVIITIIIIVCRNKRKFLNNYEWINQTLKLKFIFLEIFLISKIFLDSVITNTSIIIALNDDKINFNSKNHSNLSSNLLSNFLSIDIAIMATITLLMYFNLSLFRVCSYHLNQRITDRLFILSLGILAIFSFIITYFLLFGFVSDTKNIIYFELPKLFVYLTILIEKKRSDLYYNNENNLLKIISEYKDLLDFFQTNSESRNYGIYLFKETIKNKNNNSDEVDERNNISNLKKLNSFNANKTNTELLNEIKYSSTLKLNLEPGDNYQNIYQTSDISEKLKQKILFNFTKYKLDINKNHYSKEFDKGANNYSKKKNINGNSNYYNNHGQNSTLHLNFDKKITNSESNIKTSGISKFHKNNIKNSLSILNNNDDLNSIYNNKDLNNNKNAVNDYKSSLHTEISDANKSSNMQIFQNLLSNTSSMNITQNLNLKAFNPIVTSHDYSINKAEKDHLLALSNEKINGKKLLSFRNLCSYSQSQEMNYLNSNNNLPKKVSSNPMLNAYLHLNNFYSMKKITEAHNSPLPYMMLGMMKSEKKCKIKKQSNKEVRFKSYKEFFPNSKIEDNKNDNTNNYLNLDNTGVYKNFYSHSNPKITNMPMNSYINKSSNHNDKILKKKSLSKQQLASKQNISSGDLNQNNLNIQSYQIKKSNIIKELTEEESVNFSMQKKHENRSLLSVDDFQMDIEQEKDSSKSSSLSKEQIVKISNKKKKSKVYGLINKSNSSKLISFGIDIDENVNLIGNSIRSFKTLSLGKLKNSKKFQNEKNFEIEKQKSLKDILEDRIENKNFVKKIKSSIILRGKLNEYNINIIKKDSKDKKFSIYDENITLFLFNNDQLVKKPETSKNVNLAVLNPTCDNKSRKTRKRIRCIQRNSIGNKINSNKNLDLNKQYISDFHNLDIFSNNYNSSSCSDLNSYSNSDRFSNSNRYKSTIRNIICVDKQTIMKELNDKEIKIFKNDSNLNNLNSREIIADQHYAEPINYKNSNESNKKLLGITNQNNIFTISQSNSTINKDKDSLINKSAENRSEINLEKINKSKNKSIESISKIENNIKFLHSDEHMNKENDSNNSKSFQEIRFLNKKINELDNIEKKEFIQNLNLEKKKQINDINKIYVNSNQNSIDSNYKIINSYNIDNKNLIKDQIQLDFASSNNINISDNIKLLSQEKPSEVSSISGNSKVYKNHFINKERGDDYHSYRNTRYGMSNLLMNNNLALLAKFNSENLSDFNLKISLNKKFIEKDQLIRLIEEEKLNAEIIKLFENENEEVLRVIEFNFFLTKLIGIFDKADNFNFYNDIGPFSLFLENKFHIDNNPGLSNLVPISLNIMISIKFLYSKEGKYGEQRIKPQKNLTKNMHDKDKSYKKFNYNVDNNANNSSVLNLNLKVNFDSFQMENNLNNLINLKTNDHIKDHQENILNKSNSKMINNGKECNNEKDLKKMVLNREKSNDLKRSISKKIKIDRTKNKNFKKLNKHADESFINMKYFLILINEYSELEKFPLVNNNYLEERSNELVKMPTQNYLNINNKNNNANSFRNTIYSNQDYLKYNPYNHKNFFSSDIKSMLHFSNSNFANQSGINFTINNNISMNNYINNNKKEDSSFIMMNNTNRNNSKTNNNNSNKINNLGFPFYRSKTIRKSGQPIMANLWDKVNMTNRNKETFTDFNLNNPDKLFKNPSSFSKNSHCTNEIKNPIILSPSVQQEHTINNLKKISSLNLIHNPNSINNNSINLLSLNKVNSALNNQGPFIDINKTIENENNLNNINNSNNNNNNSLNNPFLFEKLSALLHDFKHVVYDNLIFFDHLVSKYIYPLIANKTITNNAINNINNNTNNLNKNTLDFSNFNLGNSNHNINIDRANNLYQKNSLLGATLISNGTSSAIDPNKLKDDLTYLNVIKDYTISMILNITNFMSDNEFLAGSLDEPIDFIKIVNLMVLIFKRRLEYENCILETLDNKNNENNINNINTMKQMNKKELSIKQKIIDPDNPYYNKLKSNQNLIISLLYNIISNSYKYTEKGEIIIESSIEKSIQTNNSSILIKIYDTGNGIPLDILNNWGKPFNFKDKSKGTGLGQFLINSISKKLGFTILKPEKNPFAPTGTLIKIKIPVDMNPNTKNPNYSLTVVHDSGIINNVPNNLMRNFANNDVYTNPFENTHINDNEIINLNNNIAENQNNSSYHMKSTLINSFPFIFDENNLLLNNNSLNIFNSNFNDSSSKLNNENSLHNIVTNNQNEVNMNILKEPQIKGKTKTSTVLYEKTINILCLDDDQIFLGMLSNHLKFLSETFPRIKFDFTLTSSFQEFFNEFISLTMRNIVIDIFVMDQNISHTLKGVDCCKLVNKFYKICYKDNYDNLKFYFFFVTEESNLHRLTINKNNYNLIRKDQIFSKMQFKKLYEKLVEIISAL